MSGCGVSRMKMLPEGGLIFVTPFGNSSFVSESGLRRARVPAWDGMRRGDRARSPRRRGETLGCRRGSHGGQHVTILAESPVRRGAHLVIGGQLQGVDDPQNLIEIPTCGAGTAGTPARGAGVGGRCANRRADGGPGRRCRVRPSDGFSASRAQAPEGSPGRGAERHRCALLPRCQHWGRTRSAGGIARCPHPLGSDPLTSAS